MFYFTSLSDPKASLASPLISITMQGALRVHRLAICLTRSRVLHDIRRVFETMHPDQVFPQETVEAFVDGVVDADAAPGNWVQLSLGPSLKVEVYTGSAASYAPTITAVVEASRADLDVIDRVRDHNPSASDFDIAHPEARTAKGLVLRYLELANTESTSYDVMRELENARTQSADDVWEHATPEILFVVYE
jgi:hypothetical protein